jgi:hypothetical protein
MNQTMRTFAFSAVATVAIWAAVATGLGFTQLLIVVTLTVLEITFSFDNAVVNAKLLSHMSPWWQRFFMTVGIFVAVFVVRFALPVFIVSLTSGLNPWAVLRLAFEQPDVYGHELEKAAPAIDSFGGIFLLMIAMSFFLDAAKRHHWLHAIESRLTFLGRYDNTGILALVLGVLVVAMTVPESTEERLTILIAGVAGIALHVGLDVFGKIVDGEGDEPEAEPGPEKWIEAWVPVAPNIRQRHDAWYDPTRDGYVVVPNESVKEVKEAFERSPKHLTKAPQIKVLVGTAAAVMFVRLEILDASFSFDGVIGAFAISSSVVVIMAGLGAGALWVRSLTVYLVRQRTLEKFLYLEHGAHWAIGVLGAIMITKLYHVHLPEWIIGLTGLAFIIPAVWSSIRHRRTVAA